MNCCVWNQTSAVAFAALVANMVFSAPLWAQVSSPSASQTVSGTAAGETQATTQPGEEDASVEDIADGVVEGIVVGIEDLTPGPSLYSDFELGGVEIFLDTEDGPVRVWLGPQWTSDVVNRILHDGHFATGDRMMVVGFTAPLSRPSRGESGRDQREGEGVAADAPFVAQQLFVGGLAFEAERGTSTREVPPGTGEGNDAPEE